MINILIKQHGKTPSVLGTETTRENNDDAARRYTYWQSVVTLHPDYRDAQYALALSAYELGKFSETKLLLERVQAIDPNYPGTEKLQLLLLRR